MDLRSWLIADMTSARQRLQGGVVDLITPDRLGEVVDGGGIAPVYVLWHLARHHDVAVNAVLRERDEVVAAWTEQLGVATNLWRGLSEGTDLDLVRELDPEAVGGYALALLDSTISWLDDAPLGGLHTVPDAAAALAALGTPEQDFGWLYSMWEGKSRYWFLSWEAHAHVATHTGELVSLRNRMGLSPF